MIGSSLPLCYPQIGSPNLFCLRALDQFCPLTKHIRPLGEHQGYSGGTAASLRARFQAVCVT
jgi:hypothetical protein